MREILKFDWIRSNPDLIIIALRLSPICLETQFAHHGMENFKDPRISRYSQVTTL